MPRPGRGRRFPRWRSMRRGGWSPPAGHGSGTSNARQARWVVYGLVGGAAAATVGPYLVLVLLACGVTEIVVRRQGRPMSPGSVRAFVPAVVLQGAALGGFGALAWVAFKVGALSYGGGFVIIPLMQHDAVTTYHWMTGAQFLNAVALGQVTPGPVVQTVAVVGYAAGGVGGGLLAALIAFAPSFAFVLMGGRHFDQIRANCAVEVVPDRSRPSRYRCHRRLSDAARSRAWPPLADPGAGGRVIWLFRRPAGCCQRAAHCRGNRCRGVFGRGPRLRCLRHQPNWERG